MRKWILTGVVVLAAGGLVAWLAVRPTTLSGGPPPMAGEMCQPAQVEVLVLGTFHFAQQDEVDVLDPGRQGELEALAGALGGFGPDAVAVEFPRARQEEIQASYERYVAADGESTSSNEVVQIGFRLAYHLGHDRVHAVDVPMNLWHDSIAVFDQRFPGARDALRRRWNVRYPPGPEPRDDRSLAEMLRAWNGDAPPGNSEFGLFLPLAEEDVYAGALKLRPWYDRNLRIVQNLFRALDEDDRRIVLVIGGSHVRVLRHLLDMTPQLCSVDPLPWLQGDGG